MSSLKLIFGISNKFPLIHSISFQQKTIQMQNSLFFLSTLGSRSSHVLSVSSKLMTSIASIEDRQRMPITQPTGMSWLYERHMSESHDNFIANELSETQYEALAEETLNSLQDFFDILPEIYACTDEFDAEFGSGVLTIHFGKENGTYVINKQTPNKQIWLSSPKTGPKRYDFCGDKWIYKHNGVGLHTLLEEEISEIVGSKVSLKDCKHYS